MRCVRLAWLLDLFGRLSNSCKRFILFRSSLKSLALPTDAYVLLRSYYYAVSPRLEQNFAGFRSFTTRRASLFFMGLLALQIGMVGCDQGTQEKAPPPLVYDPPEFADILYPEDNPTTALGLALGKKLFADPILSADSSISCQTCHQPALAFTDGKALSVGIAGRLGRRNSPSLANIGYRHSNMFWDGRASDLESQALHPVADPREMGGDWPSIIAKLRKHPLYSQEFVVAFSLNTPAQITPDQVGKALAQYQRSLITYNSRYDQFLRGEAALTAEEERGRAIFFDEADLGTGVYANFKVGECAHCHTAPHFTNHRFFNNGLDEAPNLTEFPDLGRGGVSGNKYENGLFRVPSLRNVALTAPYMHDGRFETLEQVIEHYNQGGHYAENRSPNVRPLTLSDQDKADLLAFLHTLTDRQFLLEHTAP